MPCGLVAWSLFNDTYNFSISNNRELRVNKRHISWKSDRDDKFGSDVFPKNFQNGSLIGGGRLNESIPVSLIATIGLTWMLISGVCGLHSESNYLIAFLSSI